MQLVAYGAQDVYITGNPQITHFKVVYRRHTNFATENIRLPLTNANFGNTAYVVVTRNADLITQCYLEINLPSLALPAGATSDQKANGQCAWVRKIGHSILEFYHVDVGGTMMDKQYADWLNIWQELTLSVDQAKNYAELIGDVPELTTLTKARADGTFTDQYKVYLPLQLWFCRNNGLALPLIALQYHEVRLYFKFRSFEECVVLNQAAGPAAGLARAGSSTAASLDAAVAVEYVYLDSDERRRFAQVGHEYLIEQVQYSDSLSVTSTSINQQLYFNHPSKMLVWAIKNGSYKGGKFLGYSATADWSGAMRTAANNLLVGQIAEQAAGQFNVYYNATLGTALTAATTGIPAGYEAFPCQIVDPADPAAPPKQGYVRRLMATQSYMRPTATSSDATTDLNNRAVLDCTHFIASVTAGAFAASTATISFLSASGAFNVLPSLSVNGLSVPILSRPVQKYADSRPAWVKAFDVTVYQHHNYGVLIDGTVNPVLSGNIKLNGQDRLETKDGQFYNRLQPYQTLPSSPSAGINVLSLGLRPAQHQPTGACNMSRIDTAQLVCNLSGAKTGLLNDALRGDLLNLGQGSSTQINASQLIVFDFSYNVFRVMSGMGGAAYSN